MHLEQLYVMRASKMSWNAHILKNELFSCIVIFFYFPLKYLKNYLWLVRIWQKWLSYSRLKAIEAADLILRKIDLKIPKQYLQATLRIFLQFFYS